MHTQALIQRTAAADSRERDQAIRIANIAGVEDADTRVSPDMPATIRYGDPNLAALFEKEARIELVEESLVKLEGNAEDVAATSAARRRAEELGVDLSTVEGTGSNGRITATDVEAAAEDGR